MADRRQVLGKAIAILGVEGAVHILHELVEALRKRCLPGCRLRCNEALLEFTQRPLVCKSDDQNEREHRSREAPLVEALVEEDDVEKRVQQIGQECGMRRKVF